MTLAAQKKLEALITKVEAAVIAVQDGKNVNLQSMDAESRTLQTELKQSADPAVRPLLLRAIMALERLTEALEKRVKKTK